MINTFKSEVTLFANKFEVTVNIDCLTSIKSLNIGNIVKKEVTKEVRKITGEVNVNISNFKRIQDKINSNLNAKNPRIEVMSSGKNKVAIMTIQYIGIQELRDKKINQIIK